MKDGGVQQGAEAGIMSGLAVETKWLGWRVVGEEAGKISRY